MAEKVTVFITKYWATAGIMEREAEVTKGRTGWVAFVGEPGRIESQLFMDGEFVFDRESAVKSAEQKRLNKIESLEKQIERLKAIDFNAKEERNG